MGLPLCAKVGTRRRFSKLVVSGEYWTAVSARVGRQPRKLSNHRPVPTQDSRDIAMSDDGISHHRRSHSISLDAERTVVDGSPHSKLQRAVCAWPL